MQILSNTKSFEGVFTALVTPFLPDGAIDWAGYDRLLDSQLSARVHGVVPCGTTGESPTLAAEEKRGLVEAAVKKCKGRALVVAGTGSNDTARTIRDSEQACDAGADALLVVTPYYNKPSQAGLEAHFRAVADASRIPVILYNVPGRTGVSLAPATLERLAAHPRIAGLKEASGNLALLTELRAAVARSASIVTDAVNASPAGSAAASGKRFALLSGDDPTYWPFLASGGHGVISVASNVLPRCVRMMYEDWYEGRVGSGLALHEKLSPLLNALFLEANPVPVKTLLSWEKRMGPKVRLPLAEILPENAEKLRRTWESLLPHLREDRPREDIRG